MKDLKNKTDKTRDIDDEPELEKEIQLPGWMQAFSDFIDDLLFVVVLVMTFLVFFGVKSDLPAFGMGEISFHIIWFIITFLILFFMAAVIRPLFKIAIVVAILISPFVIYNKVFRKPEVTHNVNIQQQTVVDTAKTETIR